MPEEAKLRRRTAAAQDKNDFLSSADSSSGKEVRVPQNIDADGRTLCKTCIFYSAGAFGSLIAAVVLTHFLSDGPVHSVSFSLPAPPKLEGPLAPNKELQNVKRAMKDKIYGPESLAVHKHSKLMYTGLRTGHLAEIKANKEGGTLSVYRGFHLRSNIDPSQCDGSYSTFPKCGRPLGLRFRKLNGDVLLIADAYHGLYEVDVVNTDWKVVLKPGTKIANDPEAPPLRYLNDFDESDDGRFIILSEPSTRFSDRDCLYALAEHGGDGRVLLYDIAKRELRVLIDGLQYPNGIQIEKDNRCVLIAEMGNARILRHCFDQRPAEYSVLIDNLPGYPDNIRLSQEGLLWVPLGEARLQDDRWITERPFLRNIIAKLTSPMSFSWLVDFLSPKYGLILLVDISNGTIVRSLHDPAGKIITSISQVTEMDDGTLLLSGDTNRFLGRLKLKQKPKLKTRKK